MGTFIVLILLLAGTVWASHYFIEQVAKDYKEQRKKDSPTKNPDKYMGPEDEPEWVPYSRRIGKWY